MAKQKRAEILAPAGNEEALQAAFAAGADAVYFGLPLFGARAFAQNFTLEKAKDIIQKAHLAGKKIYVTMNTLLEESDMEKAAAWAKELHEAGVDALIIQDLGLLHLLHHTLPDLELHASTQLSVNRPEQIEKLKKLGVKRVVLAREATMEEIEACAKTGMELEAFVHGAICISYSGQCGFSRIRYGRSGNKGACAQPCRMEYTLIENGKPLQNLPPYLLSPKDLSLLQDIPALEKAGVDSLKIEGRMKSPEYVYQSVKAAVHGQQGKKIKTEEMDDLKTVFNRGLTKGHTFGKTGNDLMNMQTSNHQGIPIGKVLSVSNGKAKIRLDKDLHQEDGIRFENSTQGGHVNFLYDANGKLVSEVKAGQIALVPVKGCVKPESIVRKTSSYVLEKEREQAVEHMHLQSPVSMHLSCKEAGAPLELSLTSGDVTVTVSKDAAQKAQKAATPQSSLEKQLKKTGDTWARVEKITFDLAPDLFIPLSSLNELRREGVQKLTEAKLKRPEITVQEYDWKPEKVVKPQSMAEIMRPQQNIENAPLALYSMMPLQGTMQKAPLYEQHGEVSAHLGDGRIVDGMNVTNSYALAALLEIGYEGAVLSDEISAQGEKDMLAAFESRYGAKAPVLKTVYEKPRLMLMKHCPVNTVLKDGTRKNCSLCRTSTFELLGKDGKKAFLYGTPECRMQIFDETAVDEIDRIGELKEEGFEAFHMVFTDESKEQTEAILARFADQLHDKAENDPKINTDTEL